MPYFLQKLLALSAIVALSPLFAIISIAVLISSGRPIFYSGERVGRNGELFYQRKFRTMVVDADSFLDPATGEATKNRITTVGRYLRVSSLDELPQLINVVADEMALIGPRPLLIETANKIDSNHPRFGVLPGISGLAQTSGRNLLPWSKRLILDAEYVATRSFFKDVQLIVRTVTQVAKRSDISTDRNAQSVMDL